MTKLIMLPSFPWQEGRVRLIERLICAQGISVSAAEGAADKTCSLSEVCISLSLRSMVAPMFLATCTRPHT